MSAISTEILKELRFDSGITVEAITSQRKEASRLMELPAVALMVPDSSRIDRDRKRARAVISLIHHELHTRWDVQTVDSTGADRYPFRQLAWALNLDASQPWGGGEPVRVAPDLNLTGRRNTYAETDGYKSGHGEREETAFDEILEALRDYSYPPINLDGSAFEVLPMDSIDEAGAEPSAAAPDKVTSKPEHIKANDDSVRASDEVGAARPPEGRRVPSDGGYSVVGQPLSTEPIRTATIEHAAPIADNDSVTMDRRVLGFLLAAGAFFFLALGALIASSFSGDSGSEPTDGEEAAEAPTVVPTETPKPTPEPTVTTEADEVSGEAADALEAAVEPTVTATSVPTPTATEDPTPSPDPTTTPTPEPTLTATPVPPTPTPAPVSLASLIAVAGDWEGGRSLLPGGWGGGTSGFGNFRASDGSNAVALHISLCSVYSTYDVEYNLDRRYASFSTDVSVDSSSSADVAFQLLFTIDNESTPREVVDLDLFSGTRPVLIDTTGALRLTIEARRVRCSGSDDFRVLFTSSELILA
ncbi:MAG: hypothetical protein AAF567_06910 [Actinomycetota bacterium]